MRYRAKKDAVVTNSSGERTLIAKEDKVYVQQLEEKWEVYSFYTRRLLTTLSKEHIEEIFSQEDGLNKPYKKSNSRFLTVLLILLLPLFSPGQVNPVNWSWRTEWIDSNTFEVQMTADISRGWWIYQPNMEVICPYSPIISFEIVKGIKSWGEIDIIYDASLGVFKDSPCSIPAFTNSVTFIQMFKTAHKVNKTLKGKIVCQALSKYCSYTSEIDIEAYITPNGVGVAGGGMLLDISPQKKCTPAIYTYYPKGIFRKTWWVIRHPFGPYYTRRRVIYP